MKSFIFFVHIFVLICLQCQISSSRIRIPISGGPSRRCQCSVTQKKDKTVLDEKREKLYEQLKPHENRCVMAIDRTDIVNSSFSALNKLILANYRLKGKLFVTFANEFGKDGGALTNEWFTLFSTEVFHPKHQFFRYSCNTCYTVEINPMNTNLFQFELIGKFTGMAIFHRKILNTSFSKSFLKAILGQKIDLEDIRDSDPQNYKSLQFVRNISTNSDLTFAIGDHELVSGGKDKYIDSSNKEDFINKALEWTYVSQVKKQMDAFLKGFNVFIPKLLLKEFLTDELELLMCGKQNIDIDQWKDKTKHIFHPDSNDIDSKTFDLFWKVVSRFDNNTRAKFLKYTTGTSRLPPNGFQELFKTNKFHIYVGKGLTKNHLPLAKTCNYSLNLPPYENEDEMQEKLIQAMEYDFYGNH